MFSETFKKERKKLGYTQARIANKLNTSRSNVANWEKGYNTASADLLLKSAELFDCTVDYLLGKTKYRNLNEYVEKLKTDADNQWEIINNLSVDEIEALQLQCKSSPTIEQVESQSSVPDDPADILYNELIDMNLVEKGKPITSEQIDVITSFIRNNKDFIKAKLSEEDPL